MYSLSSSSSNGALRTALPMGVRSMSQWWGHVTEAPKDPILGISEAFKACTHPDKMNLGVGAYRDDNGKPVVLDCVREAEKRIMGNCDMEYLPIGGLSDFCDHSIKLAYGEEAACIAEGRVASLQSLSGTGSCRLMADFMHRFKPEAKIYIPKPTWSNHHTIWKDARVEEALYRYYLPETRGLDFDGLMSDVKDAPKGSFFLLHACAHNPTGVDPTAAQWSEISGVMKEKGHFPFFDMAYQGFASGDCVRDAQAISIFLNDGHELGCSQSYAKNMGLYGQRVGCLSIVTGNKSEASAVGSQLRLLARPTYSNPPVHGARIVSTVLGDAELKAQWYNEVKVMAERIIDMRAKLRASLEASGSTLPWQHVTDQIGMFCFSGMTGEMVDKLAKDHYIFMTRNGRISMAGVTSGTVDRLAKAMHEVTSA
mmetsp:Transcript_28693/g.39638  ORF Transcript_28693/g.39638 Transcript_28693/m.39638 type:complete len:425 (-) Transcript_28693:154-1428(-)|eukprot:CAMPEP_0196576840 /NCGR_PEP_ID=MMETSP1081-20130531/6007_1 /TAXON_ID=36882 /ORGANISM="Pyramimonas amylifera, Strain CCMP720" /LENGTH=424 /DNA_ID=CAMNT_0041895555 /DNA_START=120 /DNA_END=1394 /DNA_ORIENTATION=+